MAIHRHDGSLEYEGAVFGTWEHNGYHDSDFYALVWDGEGLRGIEYGSTRHAGGGGATTDATEDIKALAGAWLAARDIESWNVATAHDALMVEKGRAIEVFKGRKVAIGTTGTAFWVGETKYGWRLGFNDADGETHWTALSNVRVTDAADRVTSVEEIVTSTDARIARLVEAGKAHEWVSAYRSYGGAIGNRFSVEREEIDALLAGLGRTEIGAFRADAVREAARIEDINRRHGALAVLESYRGEAFAEDYEDMDTEWLENFARTLVEKTAARIEEKAEGGGLMALARKIDGGA